MPARDADRNLLFGILALQMDFITRDALIAAMNAWALEKHRPIGEILVERGALDPKIRALLGPMVEAHVERHGGDPAASLASLSSVDSAASSLGRSIADPEVRESLDQLTHSLPADAESTLAYEPRDPRPAGVRYRKVRDHARGGLGVVYVARDEELNREVALKEIQGRHADDPDKRARFVVEAEITGRLEHPGIVPVYGLGSYDDGRPFYAMRFIKGDSLKDAIAGFHVDETLRKDPGARTLALQKLLRRFLDVCNAVAYAHSRGVLHRDLKPANVMVGKYGETLVVDWGLAKAAGRSDPDGTDADGSTMLAPTSETQPGTRLGTPAYMSPEQAAGRLDLLGPASDVYGLGATLYSLLTGRRAFQGEDLPEIYRKIGRGEFPRPRELSPRLDPALEAICLKAMALRPADRYATPRALADDIERWLADEPVAAHREPWSRKARRWRRRHRTAVTSTVAVATVTAVLFGGYIWQRADQRRRTDTSALATLERAEGLADGARTSRKPGDWDRAISEARIAREALDSGGGSPALLLAVTARLEGFQVEKARLDGAIEANRKDRQVVADLDEASLIRPGYSGDPSANSSMTEACFEAFRAYGIDVGVLPVEEAAKRIRSSKVGHDLVSALDLCILFENDERTKGRLMAIVRASETDPRRASLRLIIARGDAAALRRLCEREEDRRQLGPLLRNVSVALQRLDRSGSIPFLEILRRENPSDVTLNVGLGYAYGLASPPRSAEAVRYHTVAVALRPRSATVRMGLGFALFIHGDHQGAIAEFRKALDLAPRSFVLHVSVITNLLAAGDHDGAIAVSRSLMALDPKSALPHMSLGAALRAKGDHDGAIREYREALALDPRSVPSHVGLGHSLLAKSDRDRAAVEYRRAIELDPRSAPAHVGLVNVLKAQGDRDGVIREYRRAVELAPKSAPTHYRLGLALRSGERADEAVAELREAVRLDGEKPGAAIGELGRTLLDLKRYDEAIATFREAIRLMPDDALAHYDLGAALKAGGDRDGAIAQARAALAIRPGDALAHYQVGLALRDRGMGDEAVAELREAIRIDGDHLGAANWVLGDLLLDLDRPDEAIAVYRRAREIGDAKPADIARAGEKIRENERRKELLGRFDAILKGQDRPKDGAETLAFIGLLKARKRYEAAARLSAEAFAVDPKLAEDLGARHRYNAACHAALAGSGMGKDDPPPDESARARLREQALGWLRADLTAWGRVLDGGDAKARKALVTKLDLWRRDTDLAGIRDEAALARLHEGEREGFRALWAEVEALRVKAGGEK